MVRDEIEDLHKKRLGEMCSQLGITVDAYFDWSTRYGYPFNNLVFKALQDHLTLLDLVRGRSPSDSDGDIVVELLQLEG